LHIAADQDDKAKRRRKSGQRASTKKEDAKTLKEFHRLRPPGRYIDTRILHDALPEKVRKKFGQRTVIRRLADKGFLPCEKKKKTDPTEATKKRRLVSAENTKTKTSSSGRLTYRQSET
jgi:hypothetical protein